MKRYGFIYKTTNIVNGKIYIGQKRYERNNDIMNPMPSYIGSGKKLANAIKKYGKENFRRKILCWCLNQEAMDDCEKFFIKHFGSINEDIGYNLCEGGQSTIPKELLNVKGENNPNYGNRWTEEMKKRLSDKAKARNISGVNNPNYGKRWSKEQRIKASKRLKESGVCKGANNPRATKVLCVDTGVIYDMISDVAKENNFAITTVSNYLSRNKKIKGKTYIKLNNNSPS